MSSPSITCPVCGMTSYNANDIREGYCGKCHGWTSAGRNQMQQRVAPGIWIDKDNNAHFSIPELLAVAGLSDTPEHRAVITAWTEEFLRKQLPDALIIHRPKPD